MPSVIRLNLLLVAEEIFTAEVKKTAAAKRLLHARTELLAHIRAVGQSSDLALAVATEQEIIKGDLARYANSKQMVGSLNAALADLLVIETYLKIVSDAKTYAIVNQTHMMDEHRRGGLPFDEARQKFQSHMARLNNLDKSRLGDAEKQIIDARKASFANARALYIQCQTQALAIAFAQGQGQE